MTNALTIISTQPVTVRRRVNLNFLKKLLSVFSFSIENDYSKSSFSSTPSTPSSHSPSPMKKVNKNFKKNLYFYIPAGVIVVLVVMFLISAVSGANKKVQKTVAGTSDERVNVEKPVATQTLDKSFSFPLKDALGKQVSTIKMNFTTAELRNQIIVKGQRATSVSGRTFLILNLKLTNNYSKSVQINTRDYVRLSVNKSDEKLAAEIHNDPVEVQAISTKFTRLGFPINETDKDLVLLIGEINGKKESITLHLE